MGGGHFPVDFPIFVPHLVLPSLLTSLASSDMTWALCHKPSQENSWQPPRGGPGLSGTWFSTFEALWSGSQEAVWGLSVWGPAEVNRADGTEPWWCGLARRCWGGALPGDMIGQHLLCATESWSGQGCELFNAYLGSVPWHEGLRGCSPSFREDIYLVLVTVSGTLPPREICKRYCLFH